MREAFPTIGRLVLALGGALAAAACTTPTPPAATAVSSRPPPLAGLDRVMGRDARALHTLFGDPDLDVREQGARKLQFASSVCVLDAYLYPQGGSREPVVTYVDARLPTGEDFDRASCIAALSRRAQAR